MWQPPLDGATCGTLPRGGEEEEEKPAEQRPLSEVSYRRDLGRGLPRRGAGGRAMFARRRGEGGGGGRREGGVCGGGCVGGRGAQRVPAERRACARPPALHVRIPAHVAQIKFKLEVNTSGGGVVVGVVV